VGRGALQGPRYQNLARGAYWVSGQPLSHGRRIQAFRQVLPPTAVLGGWSAAWALGLPWAEASAPVEVVMPADARARTRRGLVVRADRLAPAEVVTTDLGPATSPARTAFDLGRRCELAVAEAVAVVDALIRLAPGGIYGVRELAATHLRARGRRRLFDVLALADPRAESRPESLLRVLLILRGLPRPAAQYQVRDPRGGFVARLDLAWPQLRIGIEYDGAYHGEPGQHSRDLRRHNRLRALGWVVIQVDSRQLADPDALIALLLDVLAARS
jgi:very-short-patch-repair endonuclease